MTESATATRSRRKQDPQKWEMPKPARGQVVVYYHRGTTSENNTDIGFVTSVGDRQISVAFRSVGYDDVYHKDDPRLKSNPELINDIDGVWEFTKDQRDLDKRLSAIEKRLEALEK